MILYRINISAQAIGYNALLMQPRFKMCKEVESNIVIGSIPRIVIEICIASSI